MANLVQRAIDEGGKLAPIVIPHGLTSGTGLMNPSVFVDGDQIIVNLRHVNYTLYHAEASQRFPSPWGPLSYLHPEKDRALRTENYLCWLNDDLQVIRHEQVEMQQLHEPIWEFTGLEDCRLAKWDDSYWLIGVRRDTTTNGEGRMEYTRLEDGKEVQRVRIPAPAPNDSYCEKNWVPVLSRPYHFIKWTCPTELVYADPEAGTCVTVWTKPTITPPADQRGSSQVIPWGNLHISITHEVNLYKNYLGQKDAVYRHRIAVWDDELNLVGLSPEPFSFLDGQIEFCAGAAVHNGDLLISFGFQDNAAFVLRVPKALADSMVVEALNAAV